MQRYHFDLVDTDVVTDVKGAMLDGDDQARRIALDLAQAVRDGRPELIGRGYEVLVRRENGSEMSRVAIDPGKRRDAS